MVLFPARALDLLREARYDANADRGFDRQASAFLWSDEWLHRARPICAEHDSRAVFYLLSFRNSLVQGEPIEEYRGPWDQLRQACPEWPGFREERSSPDLARALKWERRLTALLPEPVLMVGVLLVVVCLFPLFLALPVGVHLSALSLQGGGLSLRAWIGFGLQIVGVLFLELLLRLEEQVAGVESQWAIAPWARSWIEARLVRGLFVLGLQPVTLLMFGLLMDGGVRFRACCCVYLVYVAGAVLLLALRWKAWTTVEVLFLRWGWAPVLTAGLPVFLPIALARGWVHFIR